MQNKNMSAVQNGPLSKQAKFTSDILFCIFMLRKLGNKGHFKWLEKLILQREKWWERFMGVGGGAKNKGLGIT